MPGTPGLRHRIGGLEKEDITGAVSHDPENHQRMVELRARKIEKIADSLPDQAVTGPSEGDLLVLGWGGTAGAIMSAVERIQKQGHPVACANVRYLNPFPKNLGEVLSNYRKVLIPELNMGQLRFVVRARYGVDAIGQNKIEGKPFLISEIESKIMEILTGGKDK